MKHSIDIYIKNRLKKLGWKDNQLADKSGISASQISKLKNGHVSKLSAQAFYSIVLAFNDNLENAIKVVFDLNKFKLKEYKPKRRNEFGVLMQKFETIENSIEEISHKTDITTTRLNELYYRNGAPEAYELILIEKAIGISTGELFEKLFKTELNKD
ncbi:MAG: helix-turn-helix domain-containing protein [Myroides sp.]